MLFLVLSSSRASWWLTAIERKFLLSARNLKYRFAYSSKFNKKFSLRERKQMKGYDPSALTIDGDDKCWESHIIIYYTINFRFSFVSDWNFRLIFFDIFSIIEIYCERVKLEFLFPKNKWFDNNLTIWVWWHENLLQS